MQFSAKKSEFLFESQFKELEDYLNHILEQQNYNFSPGTDNVPWNVSKQRV